MLQVEIQDFGAEAEYSFLPRNLCLLSSWKRKIIIFPIRYL